MTVNLPNMHFKEDDSLRLLAAKTVLKRLEAMTKEIEGVRAAQDIEYIHRMRVASRRLRTALNVFQTVLTSEPVKKWKKQTRKVTKCLGKARDKDVQIAFLQELADSGIDKRDLPGIKRLILRYQQKRNKHQTKVNKGLKTFQSSATADEINAALKPIVLTGQMNKTPLRSKAVYRYASEAITNRLEDFFAYSMYVRDIRYGEELHQMRIAAKKLRYSMEIFEDLYDGELTPIRKSVKKIQTLLGDFHDCEVWLAELPAFLEKERKRTMEYFGHARPFGKLVRGINLLEDNCGNQRQNLHKQFVYYWQLQKEQNTWNSLRRILIKWASRDDDSYQTSGKHVEVQR